MKEGASVAAARRGARWASSGSAVRAMVTSTSWLATLRASRCKMKLPRLLLRTSRQMMLMPAPIRMPLRIKENAVVMERGAFGADAVGLGWYRAGKIGSGRDRGCTEGKAQLLLALPLRL